MIKVTDLCVDYGDKQKINALDMVNLTVEEGEIVAIIGASGCGKSTLLKTIGGIVKASRGTIEIGGTVLDPKEHLIGYIPQGYGLLPWKTVMENCLLPLKIRKISIDKNKKAAVRELLDSLEIGNLSNRYPATLSGGQKQRVALARALCWSPQIMLMDEPFSALDAIMRDEAAEIFLRVWKQNRCSTILVTHSIDEAIYIGKRIVVMGSVPGRIKRIVENPLYGDSEYKVSENYKEIYHLIKEEIREVAKK